MVKNIQEVYYFDIIVQQELLQIHGESLSAAAFVQHSPPQSLIHRVSCYGQMQQ